MKAGESVFGKVRVLPTGNNQRLLVKWAEDYLFEKHVEELKAAAKCPESNVGGRGPCG
ncbi:MAG: hypothetical protein M3348_01900 [Acidobacteriota bacterium]|nr:hypothetical protein [Acidobacteriota bacterium]